MCSTPTTSRAIAANLASYHIDGLLMIGGWAGYTAAAEIYRHREAVKAFRIPIICLPTSIDNNLPGSELSIGADTALNSIVVDVDKIKQSAVAARRVFVVEVMGRDCGYLALMSGLASGAEHVYLPRGRRQPGRLASRRQQLDRRLPAWQAARANHPQRERRPGVHDRIHVRALRKGRRRLVRRAPGDPGPRATGRQPHAV